MTTAQTPTVEREIRIEARPETVFPFLVDQDKMIRWMGSVATLDPRPGGGLSIQFSAQHEAVGQYLEIEPPRRVVFTWGYADPNSQVPAGSSRVEIDLVPDGAATVLRLKHTGLSAGADGEHAKGWDYHLEILAAIAITAGEDTNRTA